MSGPQTGAATWFRGLVARAIADDPTAFVVPDLRIARANGLDPVAAGLRVVDNPRHASVLLVVGDLPPGLAEAASVVHAQMPPPRLVLGVATDLPASVLKIDIVAAAGQASLDDAVRRSRALLARRVCLPMTKPVAQPVDRTTHPEEAQGQDLMSHGDMCAPAAMDSAAGKHGETGGHGADPETDQDERDHHEMGHGGQTMDHGDQAMDDSGHMMGHGDHAMGQGDDDGFMSMIAMTKDLPRSRDGLPMEWVETAFGPLFAGLPAGLALTLTLDGDTVATATVKAGVTHRGIASSLPCPVAALPDLLARLDPLAPASYRVLASRALEAIAVPAGARPMDHGWAGATEWERAVSHLGWLAAFAQLLGVSWLADRAGELQLAPMRAGENGAVDQFQADIERFVRTVNRIPLLGRRLTGIGTVGPAAGLEAKGPVARGAGVLSDARIADSTYAALGFTPVVRDGGDARARLDVRLAEIGQSLALVARAGSRAVRSPDVPPGVGGAGMAVIETPRGTATLRVEVADGQVRSMRLDTPSARNLPLVPRLTQGAELADALVAIASLDLSPWEVDQ